jgi:putative transposase
MSRKKLYRIYRVEKLMVRRRGRRKRAIGTRAPLALADTINRRWSLDFVSDTLSDGPRFRIFCVVTTLAANAWPLWSTPRSVMCGWCARTRAFGDGSGGPRVIVSDNGCELASVAVLRWSIGRLD